MKKRTLLSLSIISTMSLLTLTSCGSNNDTSVSAMNETPMPIETSTITEETSSIEILSIETETTSIEETTPIETDTEIHSETETEGGKETDIDNEASDLESTDNFTVTPLSQVMYTQKDCNVREKPSTEYEILDFLNKATEVKVTGKVNEVDWYEVEINGEKGYIAASLLGDTKPSEPQATPSTNTDTGTGNQNPSNPPAPSTPSGYTPNGDGTYTDSYGDKYKQDENGNMRRVNPATGDIYKDGEKTQNGWTYRYYDF